MERIQLDDAEVSEVEHLLAEVTSTYQSLSCDYLSDATVWAHRLPTRLRKRINDLRVTEGSDGIVVVSGLPVNDEQIGKTPASLNVCSPSSATRREEAFLILLGVLLGDLIAWSTQQSGRVTHDIFPIQEHEEMQLGTGSRQLLAWHTEDAFHPFRSDYLALLCLRNPQQVPTTFASIESIDLDDETKTLLFQEHFTILPDESHRGITGRVAADESEVNIERMLSSPEKIAVLFGNPSRPYIRLDPYFMPLPEEDAPRRALDTLIEQINSNLGEFVLQPGDVCILDNYRVVHGRRPFEAHFDGTDRWLKRVLVARDLRKSASARIGASSRVIA
jgi:enduracididine beta-hydroxylase